MSPKMPAHLTINTGLTTPNGSDAGDRSIFLTISSLNYLPQVVTLFESLRPHYPRSRFVFCVVDEVAPGDVPVIDGVNVINAADIGIKNFDWMTTFYQIIELNTAVKPFMLDWIFQNYDCDAAYYLDPDLYFYRPMHEIHAVFAEGGSIVLTPHAMKPVDDGFVPSDANFLLAGSYNLGFVALRRCEETARFLKWWCGRLEHHCVISPRSDLFVDQRWIDLAPSYFDGVHILRHPGYNVAYWNVFQRDLRKDQEGWTVDGMPLVFFHFSGLPFDDMHKVSKYQERLKLNNLGAFAEEFTQYGARLVAHGAAATQSRPFAYTLRHQGKPISSLLVRQCIRASGLATPPSVAAGADTLDLSFLNQPAPELPADEWFPLTQLMYFAWLESPDLRDAFPLFTRHGRHRFIAWFLLYAPNRFSVEEPFLNLNFFNQAADQGNANGNSIAISNAMLMLWLTRPDWQAAFNLTSDSGRSRFLITFCNEVAGEKPVMPSYLLPLDMLGQEVGLFRQANKRFSMLEYSLYLSRDDLSAAFDLRTADGRSSYRQWLDENGSRELPLLRKLTHKMPIATERR